MRDAERRMLGFFVANFEGNKSNIRITLTHSLRPNRNTTIFFQLKRVCFVKRDGPKYLNTNQYSLFQVTLCIQKLISSVALFKMVETLLFINGLCWARFRVRP